MRGLLAASVNSELFATLAIPDRNVRRDRVLQAVNSAAHGIPSVVPMLDDVVAGAVARRATSRSRRPGRPRVSVDACRAMAATTR